MQCINLDIFQAFLKPLSKITRIADLNLNQQFGKTPHCFLAKVVKRQPRPHLSFSILWKKSENQLTWNCHYDDFC